MSRYPPFLLQRHLFVELFMNLVVSLVVITSVFFAGMVLQSIYRYSNLPMTTILTVVPFFLPRALTFTIPLTVLIATVQTYGRWASDNEIVAVRVGGIHLWHLIVPVLVLGILMSAVAFQFNATIVPESLQRWKKITRSSIDDVLTNMRPGDHTINIQRRKMSLTVNEDGTFSGIVIVEPDGGGMKIVAKRATVSVDREDEKLMLMLHDATIRQGDSFANHEQLPIGFSLSDQQKKMRLPLKEVGLDELLYRLERDDLSKRHPIISTELHKRIALSFASLVFAILGAPLGIVFRQGGRMKAFFMSFMFVLVLYYPLTLLGEAVSSGGRIPAGLGMWLANGMIGAIGLVLLIRVFRE